MSKERLDAELVKRGFFDARSRAASEIMSGKVLVNGKKCEKPGTRISADAKINLLAPANPYVSRGGLKLAGAYREFGFFLEGKVVIDIGASTGGFTHFALEHGASRIYAVDVGYGQLEWQLRNNPAVVNMERTNARYLLPEDLEELPDLALVDVSFISLEKIIPVLAKLEAGEMVLLVKPQFEAGKEEVGKKGVVRDVQVHREVLRRIIAFGREQGYRLKGAVPSPLPGPQGNVEFFVYLERGKENDAVEPEEAVEQAVRKAGTLVREAAGEERQE